MTFLTSITSTISFIGMIYKHLLNDMREMVEVIEEGDAISPPQV